MAIGKIIVIAIGYVIRKKAELYNPLKLTDSQLCVIQHQARSMNERHEAKLMPVDVQPNQANLRLLINIVVEFEVFTILYSFNRMSSIKHLFDSWCFVC